MIIVKTWRSGETRITCYPWHKWFAWRPVFTEDRGFVWLRFVWRRHVFHELPPEPGMPGSFYSWQYLAGNPNAPEQEDQWPRLV